MPAFRVWEQNQFTSPAKHKTFEHFMVLGDTKSSLSWVLGSIVVRKVLSFFEREVRLGFHGGENLIQGLLDCDAV
jgi:hypothetical protein